VGSGRGLLVSKDGLGTYRSVQAAMNDAVHGDTIRVNPGVYEERIEFKNGITVVGSGVGHTIIRYGYGFDEVLHAQNIVSGRIEAVTLERMASVLDAAVVVLESAAMTFVDCSITGAQRAGVHVSGLSAKPLFEACEIFGNGLHGIVCESGAVVRVAGSTIHDNSGAGILAIDSLVNVNRTTVARNGATGIALTGVSQANLEETTIEEHLGWGLDASDTTFVELDDCRFSENSAGAIRIANTAVAAVRDAWIIGGAIGIRSSDTSELTVGGSTVREATVCGIQILDAATCQIERSEIVECTGHAVEFASTGTAAVRFATISRNGGDGVVATGTTVAVTESIISLNDGVGLRVAQQPSVSDPPTFGHNAVWGNGSGDYMGTARRSSDLAAYPGFVDPEHADYTLRFDSPCIGAGARGATIGAHLDPTRGSGTAVRLTVHHEESPLGLDLMASIDLKETSPFFDGIRLRAGRHWDAASLVVESSLLGSSRGWLRVHGVARLLNVAFPSESGSDSVIRATFGVDGVLDGIGSRTSRWVCGEFASTAASFRAEYAWDDPANITHQSLELRLGQLSVAARATMFTLNELNANLASEAARPLGTLSSKIGLSMLPETAASLEAGWKTEGWELGGRLTAYVEDLESGELSLSWSDIAKRSRIDLIAEVDALVVADIALRAALWIGDLSVESEVGVNVVQGVRFRLAAEIATARWFLPTMNLPPVPRFEYGPFEPEAGEPVLLDASGTSDPDGTVVEYWWDFGDGSIDIGNPISHIYAEGGTYDVSLTVADDDGDTTTRVQSIMIFAADTTPTASFTWAPISDAGTQLMRPLRAGDRARLDASSSLDPDGSIVEYAWDLESDGSFDLRVDNPRVSIEPLTAGTWPVTLRVTDDTGRTDAVMRVLSLEDPKPPTAAFDASPSTPSVFDSVRFIDRSAGSDGPIVSWEWSFGDGHSSRVPEPIHRFEQTGTYEVRLTVIDSLGLEGTYSETLDVEHTPEVVPVGNVWALVIGISEYEEVERLPFARRDAEAIVAWLLENDVPAEQIRLMTGVSSESSGQDVIDSVPATLVNVREGLGWLRRAASKDDLVLIHFSGHGYQGADDDYDEIDAVDEFFVLSDTRATAKDDTALRDDEFGRFLDRIESEHVLVFFDSCYSGGLSRSLPPGKRSTGDTQDWFGDLRLEGRVLLSASSEGEEAFESPQLEHGVFTHFLLEGLDGAADLNADYHVTVWELFEYVAARVPDFVAAERGEPQHPQLLGEGETRIVLSYRERPLEAAFSYCPAVPYVGGVVGFSDESSGNAVAIRTWSFGDGTSDTGERSDHVYEAAGSYDVLFVVTNEEGERSQMKVELHVEPAGAIEGIDDLSGRVLISLGARNGVRVGDRLAVDTGKDTEDPLETVLEVIELVGEDRSACRVVEGTAAFSPDAKLVPIQSEPCMSSD